MISIIIPVYKSAVTLFELHSRLTALSRNTGGEYEVIYVNDASPDNSMDILKSLPPSISFHIVDLKKNVGQSSALLVGIALAKGSLIATMDADLQDEPENLPSLIQALLPGIGVVFAKRQGRYESAGRLFTSLIFKGLVHIFSGRRIPMHVGLFFVARAEPMKQLVSYLPHSPYLIGLIARTKLPCTSVTVERPGNQLGETSYTFRKRLEVAFRFFRTLRLTSPGSKEEAVKWLNANLLSDHLYIPAKPWLPS